MGGMVFNFLHMHHCLESTDFFFFTPRYSSFLLFLLVLGFFSKGFRSGWGAQSVDKAMVSSGTFPGIISFV